MFLVVLTVFSCVVPAYAEVSAAEALANLKYEIICGNHYFGEDTSVDVEYFSDNEYKRSGGGYFTYAELTESTTVGTVTSSTRLFNAKKYESLTSGSKQDFLKDILKIANSCSYYEINSITDDTVTDLYNELQNYSGMGSQLMASLLAETKPDYATANRIYQPFSGVVGTILGFLSVIVMALLGVTMALDICYITIPAFQLIIGAEKDGSGGGNGATKFAAKIISTEAQKAVQVSQNDGQNGEFKSAIGVYFKYRWKGLLLLGICLLYLVGGHIWNFVAWFIDLLSGFLGF